MVAAVSHLRQNWHTHPESHTRVAGYTTGTLAFMIFGLLDTISPGARPDFIFWILLAGTIFFVISANNASEKAPSKS